MNCLVPPSFLRQTWHHFNGDISYFEKLRENFNMYFKDDPKSDMHAKIIQLFDSEAFA